MVNYILITIDYYGMSKTTLAPDTAMLSEAGLNQEQIDVVLTLCGMSNADPEQFLIEGATLYAKHIRSNLGSLNQVDLNFTKMVYVWYSELILGSPDAFVYDYVRNLEKKWEKASR